MLFAGTRVGGLSLVRLFSSSHRSASTLLSAEQTASRRVVTIALPDLSNLRGHTAVLAFRLRNSGAEPRRIGLLRDGLPASRVVLPPNRTISWDIVLSPEIVQALHAQAGDAARTLELTGDADVWAVMAFEIRNYHVRWGDRPMAVVLPTRADRYTAGDGIPAGRDRALFSRAGERAGLLGVAGSARRLIGNGLALTASSCV